MTTYQSGYPQSLYGGNLQDERASQDAATIARARDYNIHDIELQAIQAALGAHPFGTSPTGTIYQRLLSIEQRYHSQLLGVGPDDHHTQSHSHDGADGSGVVQMFNQTSLTGVFPTAINEWMYKIYGTGDINQNGILDIEDVVSALAMNKEMLDDTAMLGRYYPVPVPTGGGPGNPPPAPGPPPGPPVIPTGGGGVPPVDLDHPVDEVWTGNGLEPGGYYDYPIGLMVDFDTGKQYPIRNYRDAAWGVLTGIITKANISWIETFTSMEVGSNYMWMYYRKPPKGPGVARGSSLVNSSPGMLDFPTNASKITDAGNGVTTIALQNPHYTVPIRPDEEVGTGAAFEQVAPGWAVTVAIHATGAGGPDGTMVIPTTGTYTLRMYYSSTQAGDTKEWDLTTVQHRVNSATPTTGNTGQIEPVGSAGTINTYDLDTGISMTAGDVFDCRVIFDQYVSNDHPGEATIHAIQLILTEMT